MATWIDTEAFAANIFRSKRQAQDIIKARKYKGVALIVRQQPSSRGGKPAYFVLWDTTTNQPATLAEGETYEAVDNPADPADADGLKVLPKLATPQPSKTLPANVAILPLAQATAPRQMPDTQTSNLLVQAQTIPSLSREELGLGGIGGGMDTIIDEDGNQIDPGTGEIINAQLDPLSADDFEKLLELKLKNAKPSSRRALRKYYREQYAQNGVVPNALRPVNNAIASCGKAGNVGRKRLLDDVVYQRFITMVKESADVTNIRTFATRAHRKVTYYHQRLEREFAIQIPINQLYSVVRSHPQLKDWLAQADDGVTGAVKPPQFFKAAPVGELVQMDGVEADYLAIWDNGKWVTPTWIEFFDQGSRKLLAMHAYLSESSENSVDIFTRFLADNAFPCLEMSIRPDNAGGFKNLRRPMKELNLRIDRPEKFMFVDDYARAGKPKDKAHLESSHRAVHLFERFIIDHFQERIAGQYQKRKQNADGSFKTVTVTQLQISLDELNDSSLIADYMHKHNAQKHRFTDNGIQKTWIPDEKWEQALKTHDSFYWKPEHIELCRIYGHTKTVATISKDGLIQYQKQKYSVADKALWSSSSSTKIKISFVDGKLAIFKNSDDGVLLGMALPLQAPVYSEKAAEHKAAKVAKLNDERGYVAIAGALLDVGMVVNDSRLGKFVKDGLTFEATLYLLDQHQAKYAKRPGLFSFNQFISDAESYLAAHKPQKFVPYAAG